MANKVYTLLDFGSAAGKPAEQKTVKYETYSDVSMIGSIRTITKDNKQTKKYRVEKNIDIMAVKNAMENLFTFLPGERVLNPDFGNKLYALLYEPIIDHTKELIIAEVKNMIATYEPRAVLDTIIDNTSTTETEDNTAKFIIEWHVDGFENSKYQIPLP